MLGGKQYGDLCRDAITSTNFRRERALGLRRLRRRDRQAVMPPMKIRAAHSLMRVALTASPAGDSRVIPNGIDRCVTKELLRPNGVAAGGFWAVLLLSGPV